MSLETNDTNSRNSSLREITRVQMRGRGDSSHMRFATLPCAGNFFDDAAQAHGRRNLFLPLEHETGANSLHLIYNGARTSLRSDDSLAKRSETIFRF